MFSLVHHLEFILILYMECMMREKKSCLYWCKWPSFCGFSQSGLCLTSVIYIRLNFFPSLPQQFTCQRLCSFREGSYSNILSVPEELSGGASLPTCPSHGPWPGAFCQHGHAGTSQGLHEQSVSSALQGSRSELPRALTSPELTQNLLHPFVTLLSTTNSPLCLQQWMEWHHTASFSG